MALGALKGTMEPVRARTALFKNLVKDNVLAMFSALSLNFSQHGQDGELTFPSLDKQSLQ